MTKFKKKNKIDTTNLISLVITDDEQVSTSLKRILTSIEGNWKVYTCKNVYSFSNSKVGVREDFTLELKFKDVDLQKIATSSSEIYFATLPDERGYYNKYKIYTFLKHLKISVPMYSVTLPFISEESVFYSFMNKKRIFIENKKVLQYEARLAIDRLVKFHTNEMFKKMIPVEPNLESCSALILKYINSFSNKVQCISHNNWFFDYYTIKKNEAFTNEYSYEHKKLSKVISLKDLLLSYSRLGKLIGSVRGIIELYTKGIISYPTNSTSTKAFITDSNFEKISDKSWGIYNRNTDNFGVSKSNVASDLFSTYQMFVLSDKCYRQTLRIGTHVIVSYPTYLKEKKIKFTEERNSLGVSQKELLTYFDEIKIPSKLWVYQLFLLCKNGLIAEVSDTSFCITALGKLVLQIIQNKVPRLLNEKSITRINEGIKNIEDEESRFDFLTDRWDRINVELSSIEEFEVPKVKSKCKKCGKRLSLNITDKNVFVRCQNPKCSNDSMLPIKIKNNLIYSKE